MKMPTRLRCLKREMGTTLIELALLLPVALMFTFGVIGLSLYIGCITDATFASIAAARYASLNGAASLNPATTASIKTLVMSYLITLPQSTSTVTTTWAPDNTVGSAVTVQVTIAYQTGIPFDAMGTMHAAVSSSATVLH